MQALSTPFLNAFPTFSLAFFLTVLFLLGLYSLSFKVGLTDQPGGRKKHQNVVPLVGGLAIFMSSSVLLFQIIYHKPIYFVFWLVCCGLVVLSALDDIFCLRPGKRFLIQLALTGLIVTLGHTVITHLGNLLGFGDIHPGFTGFVLTAIAMVGIMNAVNMMDGIDGLTGCVTLVELGCLLFLACQHGARTEAQMIIVFMGCILGFLVFNFPSSLSEKRKVFLGDVGSTLIGLTLAWLCVRLTQGHAIRTCPPVLMLWVMALPLMDALHLMINRKLRGVSPFQADRRHIHHILLQLTGSVRQTVLFLTLIALLLSTTGLYLVQQGTPDYALFVGILVLFAAYSSIMYWLKKRASQRKMLLRAVEL